MPTRFWIRVLLSAIALLVIVVFYAGFLGIPRLWAALFYVFAVLYAIKENLILYGSDIE